MTPDGRGRILVAVLVAVAGILISTPRALTDDARDRRREEAGRQSVKAALAFDAIMGEPDRAIPRELLAKARAIAVFPDVVKVALTVGGEVGRGVVCRRQGDTWGRPVFVRAAGPSFGVQIGVSSTDFVLLFMNDESVNGLMKDRVELGGELSVAAGPVGRNAGAGTDALMHAAILSWSRSRGVFAGADLKSIVVQPEDDLNLAVYDKTARELLQAPPDGDAAADSGLDAFPQALTRGTEKS